MKILIIEPSSPDNHSLKTFLKNNNYIIDNTDDINKSSYLILINNYDLIIIKNLPIKNINSFLINKKQNKNTTPVLVISTCQILAQKINFLENGADDYLHQPFSSSELHARIKSILRRTVRNDINIINFADLTINNDSHEVSRSNHLIYLTTKEFSLLNLLIKQPGFIYSKKMITEQVWDEASNHLSNTIEVHVLRLRKKIDFKKPFLIKTVPGYGYKLSFDP
jgi:DNA-binding response OmpR family regulator